MERLCGLVYAFTRISQAWHSVSSLPMIGSGFSPLLTQPNFVQRRCALGTAGTRRPAGSPTFRPARFQDGSDPTGSISNGSDHATTLLRYHRETQGPEVYWTLRSVTPSWNATMDRFFPPTDVIASVGGVFGVYSAHENNC
jgi:hypothetical protein